MNVAILRGQLSSPPRQQKLASGDTLVSLEVTTRSDQGQAISVPVAWFPKRSKLRQWKRGQEVVVVGQVRRRFFRTAGGATASRTEVVADEVVPADNPTKVATVVGVAVAGLEVLLEGSDRG